MLRTLKNRKAQNTMEYAIIIALVIGVFSAMQIYLKRGMQARIKAGTDTIPGIVATEAGKADLFGTAAQYEPYYTREGAYSMTTETKEGTERGTASEAGGVRDLSGATTKRTAGSQEITAAKEDLP